MPQSYDERQDQKNAHLLNQSRKARDIGELPAIVDPKRRKKCEKNLKQFILTYARHEYTTPVSKCHFKAIETMEQAILKGGYFALAMPKGWGKTQLGRWAVTWALLYGHRSFIVFIAATREMALGLLQSIKIEIEINNLLLEDFPEVCYPIRTILDRGGVVSKQADGQLCQGERTNIGWTSDELTLPTIKGSKAAGARIKVAGITGTLRGMQAKRAGDGVTIRPDFVMLDDIQTNEAAENPAQVRKTLATINKTVLGLAGRGKKISAVMACTVISRDDVSDQLLDQQKNPQWQGERFAMLDALPTNTKAWEAYSEVWAEGFRNKDLSQATDYYRKHQKELDEGAIANWKEDFLPSEASAIQHAMNIRLERGEEAFYAEYQNDPFSLEEENSLNVKPEMLPAKIVALARGIVPEDAQRITASIDIQGDILFYCVTAFSQDFTAHVVDYGTYPEQQQSYFTLSQVNPTLAQARPGITKEGQLHDGLTKLVTKLLGRTWKTTGNAEMHISRCLVDAGYLPEVVKRFCMQSPFRALLLPAKGYGITADKAPMLDWKRRPGQRWGWNWRVNSNPDYHILFDTNSWKTLAAQRLLMATGETGSWTVFKATDMQHRMFFDHLASEHSTPTEGLGRVVNIFKTRLGTENHWWDTLIGCAVGASEQGIMAEGHEVVNQKPKQITLKPRRRLRITG